jgi:2-desacetyl-2-hydroxyethyl bacteriochlorophyllide A dehydrogenase
VPEKFVVTGQGQWAFEKEPPPSPAPGQILCQALSVGLCGTDRLIFAGEMPAARYPVTPCHEVAAKVLADRSDRGLAPGAFVCIDPYKNCGECHACRLGRANCCRHNQTLGVQRDGILREQFVIDADRAHVVPPSADPRLFCLAEPLALALHIVARAGEVKDRWCLVAGAGNVGKLVMRLLRRQGAKIIAWDVAPSALQEAERIGAQLAVNGNDAAAEHRVLEATAGEGVSVAFETAGQARTVEACIQLAAFAGRVVLVGHSKQAARVLGSDVVFKELDIRGSRNSQGQMPRAVEMLAAEPQTWETLISHRFPFHQAAKAFRLVAGRETPHSKVVVDFPLE